jgi:hypothetical protein
VIIRKQKHPGSDQTGPEPEIALTGPINEKHRQRVENQRQKPYGIGPYPEKLDPEVREDHKKRGRGLVGHGDFYNIRKAFLGMIYGKGLIIADITVIDKEKFPAKTNQHKYDGYNIIGQLIEFIKLHILPRIKIDFAFQK